MKKLLLIATVVMAVQLVTSNVFANVQEAEPSKDAVETVAASEEKVEAKAVAVEKLMDEATKSLDKAAAVGGAVPTGDGTGVDPNLQAYLDYKDKQHRREHPGAESEIVPIVVVPSMFLMTILLVYLPLYLRNKKRLVEAEVQRKAIEAGLQFVPELPAPPPVKRNDKRTGLLIASIGIAAAVPIALYGYPREAVFGLAFVFLGGAYFLAGKYLALDEEK